MRIRVSFSCGDQSGAALVIALIIMIVLTVIAVAASFTSIFEIKLSGNKRAKTDAFYTADGGVQAVIPGNTNFYASNYTLIPNSGSLPQTIRNEPIDSKFSSPALSLPTGVSFADPPDVTIYHTTKTGAPIGLGLSATGNYDFAYYVIDSIGRDQIDASLLKSLKSNCEIIEKVLVLVPSAQGGN